MSELLYRGFAPEIEIRSAAKGGDGRVVEGLAVPYGRTIQVNANLRERFAPGSSTHQLAAAHRVKFARGHMALGGALIGRAIELRDDPAGLVGAWRVSKTVAGDETLALIEDGALDELSVGFRERRNRTLPDGTIERVRVDLFEVAAVPEGAYGQAARISALRGIEGTDDGEPVESEDIVERSVEHERRERLARARQILAGLPPLPV